MKAKLAMAAILSTATIATGVVLGAIGDAEACPMKRAAYYKRGLQQSWLHSPLAAAIALPGVALAVALYRGGRNTQET